MDIHSTILMKSTQFSASHCSGSLEVVVVAGEGVEVGLCKEEYPPQVIPFNLTVYFEGITDSH